MLPQYYILLTALGVRCMVPCIEVSTSALYVYAGKPLVVSRGVYSTDDTSVGGTTTCYAVR